MADTGYLINYTQIFEDPLYPFPHFLEGFGFDLIVRFSSHFLGLEKKIYGYDRTVDIIKNWFSGKNTDVSTKVLKKIDELSSSLKKNLFIIHPYSVLSLFEYSYLNLPKTSTISDEESQVMLFKCILALNEEFNKRDELVISSSWKADKKENFPATTLTLSLIDYDLMAYRINELIITQFIKAALVFKLFENYSENTRQILSEFVLRYKSPNWREYLKRYFPLVHSILKREKEGSLDYIVTKNEKFEDACSFLDSLILNDKQSLEDLDFISVRSNPFMKIDKGIYRLISPVFSCEKIYECLYFEFAQINKILRSENKPHIPDDFRGFYCLKYSEEYLLSEILNRSIPNKHVKFSGEDFRNKGVSGEPDYYWRNGNKIFLFESKDTFINAEIKKSNNFQLIEEAIKNKFYYFTEGKSTHYIGISQLISNIHKILNNDYKFDSFNSQKVRIFPLLVIHHNIFNVPGLNQILNNWFKDELKKLEENGLNVSNVNELVVIDINTFILYGEQFRNKKLHLELLIADYIEFSKGQLNKLIAKSPEERAKDSMDSFTSFISVHKKLNWKVPTLFSELGLSLFIN